MQPEEKNAREHLKKFPCVREESVYSKDAVDWLHRNPDETPGLFCMGAPHTIAYYNTREIEEWLKELKSILERRNEEKR